jgi:hypothetical protein
MGFHDEVHFLAPIPPIVELTLSGRCRVRQMGADRGLNQSAAKFSIRTRLARADAGSHRHQRGVQYLQLWARASAARRVTRVLRQAPNEAFGGEGERARICRGFRASWNSSLNQSDELMQIASSPRIPSRRALLSSGEATTLSDHPQFWLRHHLRRHTQNIDVKLTPPTGLRSGRPGCRAPALGRC